MHACASARGQKKGSRSRDVLRSSRIILPKNTVKCNVRARRLPGEGKETNFGVNEANGRKREGEASTLRPSEETMPGWGRWFWSASPLVSSRLSFSHLSERLSSAAACFQNKSIAV